MFHEGMLQFQKKNKNIIETQEHTINKNRKQIQMSEVFGNVFLD